MALFRAAALPAAAAISAALGLAVVPAAHAAAPAAGPAATVKVGVAAPSSLYLLPQGADEPAVAAQYRTFSVGYYVADEASPTGVTITGNASALVGKADLQLPSACSWTSSAHTGFSCDAGRIEFAGELDFRVRSAVGAAEGATGALTFAVHGKNISADGGKDSPANYRTVFTVGHGPDLAVNQAMGDSGFSLYGSGAPLVIASKAGVQAPVRITNKGDRDASDIYVVVGASGLEDEQGVRLASTWSNCLYDPMDPSDALCHFPNAVIHPGETYQLSPAVTVTGDPTTASGFFDYAADVAGGELIGKLDTSGAKPGKGTPLQLVPVTTPKADHRAAVPDIDYSNNIGLRAVTGAGYNLAAQGGSLRLTVGKVRTLTVGIRNTGTSAAQDGGLAVIGLPAGVRVTRVPDTCDTDILQQRAELQKVLAVYGIAAGDLKGSQFVFCAPDSSLPAGHSATFKLSVEATRPLTGAVGSVNVRGVRAEANLADNLALLHVTATRAAASSAAPSQGDGGSSSSSSSASATPAASTPASSASASGSGGLASTGGGQQTAPLLLTGVGALLLGGGVVALTRRRRTR